jgi:PAT family beta-lactamase induction signal transducer AmpG
MGSRPHPFVWTILYLPFGGLGGFVSVAMTFEASKHGISVSDAQLLNASQLLTSWMKWTWAPLVDVTLTPKKWYLIATITSALGVLAMSTIPLEQRYLPALLAVICVASLVNSMVGMSLEAMLSANSEPSEHGRVSGYFQAGNLGGNGLGGGLGLLLIERGPAPWLSGAVMAALFLLCCLGLPYLRDVPPASGQTAVGAVRQVFVDLRDMLRTKGGLLAALLCLLPVGTGAVQGILTQATVAQAWGAGETQVALIQGLFAGVVTAIGCFAGGWVCSRVHPQAGYAAIGLGLAVVASLMAVSPATPMTYLVGNLVYSFGLGLAYAAFTAVALNAMGSGSGATKYNIFASLSNFPIWWLGLLLGQVAERWAKRAPGTGGSLLASLAPNAGAAALQVEAALGVAAIVFFVVATRWIRGTSLPETGAGSAHA